MPKCYRFQQEFDSELEMHAWVVSLDQQRQGLIFGLRRPEAITLAAAWVDADGRTWPEITYSPDQVYTRSSDGRTVYIEVKPPRRRDEKGRLLPDHKQPPSWRRDVPLRLGMAARLLPEAIFIIREGTGA